MVLKQTCKTPAGGKAKNQQQQQSRPFALAASQPEVGAGRSRGELVGCRAIRGGPTNALLRTLPWTLDAGRNFASFNQHPAEPTAEWKPLAAIDASHNPRLQPPLNLVAQCLQQKSSYRFGGCHFSRGSQSDDRGSPPLPEPVCRPPPEPELLLLHTPAE